MRTILILLLSVGIQCVHAINDKTLYRDLKSLDIKHPKIVLAQAKLESGNYTSNLCKSQKNLFGIKSKGKYKYFKSYKECILYYKEKIQSRYTGGDYYVFLRKTGYASDRAYTKKLKNIVNNLKLNERRNQ